MNQIDRELALKAMRLGYKLSNETEGPDGITMLVLERSRQAAATALLALVDVRPDDADNVRMLQNEVKRYLDMMAWVRDAIANGAEASRIFAEEDHAAIRSGISGWRTDDEYNDQSDE